MGGHQTRTGVLAWSSCILSSGSRDKDILQHDIRVPGDYISKFSGHRSEVCGLKWSHDDRELASGGNDNQLLVWNQRSQHPVLRLTQHTAAVKAIAWSPHQQGLLASGGGTADRCIRFWNTANGNVLNSLDTGSQAKQVATLTGHTMRVLYLASSPDGQTPVRDIGLWSFPRSHIR
nr:unnamed protein product [Digitaria exilis]